MIEAGAGLAALVMTTVLAMTFQSLTASALAATGRNHAARATTTAEAISDQAFRPTNPSSRMRMRSPLVMLRSPLSLAEAASTLEGVWSLDRGGGCTSRMAT